MKIAILSRDKNFACILQKMILNHLADVGDHSAYIVILNMDSSYNIDFHSIQILFWDVDAVPSNGTIGLSTIRECYPNLQIVLITEQTVLASITYQVGTYRYILKERVKEEVPLCMDAILSILSPAEQTIQISGIYGDFFLELIKISYFEGSARRRVFLHTTSHSVIECRGKLADYTNRLQEQGFLRLQRSYLANMFHILEIKNYLAILDSGERLKTTEKNYAQICSYFHKWKNDQNVK